VGRGATALSGVFGVLDPIMRIDDNNRLQYGVARLKEEWEGGHATLKIKKDTGYETR
jgi:hypothetical protein